MEYPLSVTDLKKTYKTKKTTVEALRGVSFNVKRGEIFGLLGPNGAGKTTMINILTGVITPDSGTVKFFGMNPCEETKNRINMATAYKSLNGILTVYQNLRVFAKIYKVKDHNEVISGLLKRFDIHELRDRRVYSLSSGQRTRVNLCKGLINSPDLIFLDEATAGLDPHIANEVRKEIKRLKTTVVFTSHIMNEVEQLCNRIAFLNKGKILKIGTPPEIRGLIKNDVFVIKFISKPGNWEEALKDMDIVKKKSNRISLRVENPQEIHEIIHKLITSGFEIGDFHIRKPSLDEVFIKIAKGEL